MSVKKMITLVTAGIASVGVVSAAIAGGAEYAPAPSYSGVYIEANVGYAYRPWLSDVTTIPGFLNAHGFISSSSNGTGGFTFGGDLGYQFNQYLALEAGWFYLPKMKFTTPSTTVNGPITLILPGVSSSISSGLAYGALKGMVPVSQNIYLFGKLGVAYTYNKDKGTALLSSNLVGGPTTTSNFWNPLFAFGSQYFITPCFSINLQYTFVPGYRRASSKRFVVPDAQLFTVGVGYKFLM